VANAPSPSRRSLSRKGRGGSAAASDPIPRLLAALARRRPLRAGSLIVTVFGDAILPRGGAVQLADLLTLLEALKLREGQARTALSRLMDDGWLAAERHGRRSLYRLTEIGRHRFEEATRRIYFGPASAWQGGWHVVILPDTTAKRRLALEKDLGWLGFGTLAAGVLLHPAPDQRSLASVIDDLPAAERPLVIAGSGGLPAAPQLARDLVERCWDLRALRASYRHFLTAFAPLGRALESGFAPAPLAALLARVMLIHDYRRIILRDPLLPAELLPSGWIADEAYGLARKIYHRLAGAAEAWIDAHLEGADGPLAASGAALAERFPPPLA
jgi:phenylacetic acid degradation operon negative regulatory protein